MVSGSYASQLQKKSNNGTGVLLGNLMQTTNSHADFGLDHKGGGKLHSFLTFLFRLDEIGL